MTLRPERDPRAALTLAGCTLATIVSSEPVITGSFGVFLAPVSQDLHWPRAELSFVLIVFSALSALCYPIVGGIADRVGARRVALIGNLLFAAAVMSLSFCSPSPVITYGLFALLGIAGAIPGPMLFSRLVSSWFDARRGVALGIAIGVGNGVGATLMPLLAAAVIAHHGWRWAYGALGLAVLCIGFPAIALLIREPPSAAAASNDARDTIPVEPGHTLAEALRTATFWKLAAMTALGAGALTGLFTHIVPMLTDRGVGLGLAASIMALVAATGSIWQVLVGVVLDRFEGRTFIAPLFVAAAAGVVLIGLSHEAFNLEAAALLVGVGIGTEYGTVQYLLGRYFGLRAFGRICGVIFAIVLVAAGVAPVLIDLVFDRTGSYATAMPWIGGALLLCGGISLSLPRYGRLSEAIATIV